MNLFYERINWENFTSIMTPINATNLNKMDYGLKTLDERVVELDTTKADQSDLLASLKHVTYNQTTGVFTFYWHDGRVLKVDLNIEKIPVSFSLSKDGILTMTAEDGTEFTADIGDILPVIAFENSETVSVTSEKRTELAKDFTEFTYAFDEPYTGNIYITPTETSVVMAINLELTSDNGGVSMIETRTLYASGSAGKSNKEAVKNITSIKVSGNVDLLEIDDANSKKIVHTFAVKEGSIKDKHLEPNYLAKIKVQAENAELSATASAESATTASEKAIVAESYAVGGTGTRDGEDTDNAKYYAEQAKETIESLEFPMPISQGGTGATTAKAAQYNLLKDVSDAAISDTATLGGIYLTPTAEKGALYRVTILKLWEHFKSKISSVLGLTTTNYSGISAKATADADGNVIADTYATKTEVTPVANLISTVAGKPLDATMGTALNKRLTTVESNLADGKVKFQITEDGTLQYSVYTEDA